MELKMFCVYDSKSKAYGTPFFAKTSGEAERSFQQAVRDPKTLISQYPEDFDLFHTGSFDELTGRLIALDSPVHMIKAVQLKPQ